MNEEVPLLSKDSDENNDIYEKPNLAYVDSNTSSDHLSHLSKYDYHNSEPLTLDKAIKIHTYDNSESAFRNPFLVCMIVAMMIGIPSCKTLIDTIAFLEKEPNYFECQMTVYDKWQNCTK